MTIQPMIAAALVAVVCALPAATTARAGHGPEHRAHHHARHGHARILPPHIRYVDPRLRPGPVRYAAPRRADFLIPAYLPRNTDAPMYNEPPPRFPQR